MKLPAFAHTRPLLFSRTGFSNLLNKIQFTFEVVPCLILSLSDDFFEGVHQFQPRVTRGWVGGWEVGRGEGVGREEAKAPQVNIRGPELPTGSPDRTTRLKGHHSSQG